MSTANEANPRRWLGGAVAVALVLLLLWGGSWMVKLFKMQYDLTLELCPSGARTATFTVYQRSAMTDYAQQFTLHDVDCATEQLHADEGLPWGTDLDTLPVTVVVAEEGGRRQVTELYRLPAGAGVAGRQRGVVVSRDGGAWPQFGSPDATPIDPDSIPRIE
uniref:hypothetical protein n=1 Tax=Tessaracoccus timonensis TaxID=2161816 RepID=UPI000D555EF2|nr:hypothetical protein [Tessaracoccus timonensis]